MYYICILLSKKHIFKEKDECCEELYWSVLVGKHLALSRPWFSVAVTSEGPI